MRLGLKIGDHDLGIKMGKVRKFLEAGHKVKVTLIYRGREQAHKEIGFRIAQRIIDDFGDFIRRRSAAPTRRPTIKLCHP